MSELTLKRLNDKTYPLVDRLEAFWMSLSASDEATSQVIRQLRTFTDEVRAESARLDVLGDALPPVSVTRLRVNECAGDVVLIETQRGEYTGKTLRDALDDMRRRSNAIR
jgi:hypothetical protein